MARNSMEVAAAFMMGKTYAEPVCVCELIGPTKRIHERVMKDTNYRDTHTGIT